MFNRSKLWSSWMLWIPPLHSCSLIKFTQLIRSSEIDFHLPLKRGTHHVFVARLLLIAHLVVPKLVLEVTKGVLVLYCWWDTKPIRLTDRWTFAVYRRRNRWELIVVPFERPDFLVPDLSMKPVIKKWTTLGFVLNKWNFFIYSWFYPINKFCKRLLLKSICTDFQGTKHSIPPNISFHNDEQFAEI